METNEVQVSNNINGLLKRYGITREIIANKLGITTRTLLNIINHPFSYDINSLNNLANAIGCNVDEFFLPLKITNSEDKE